MGSIQGGQYLDNNSMVPGNDILGRMDDSKQVQTIRKGLSAASQRRTICWSISRRTMVIGGSITH